jgi:trafficking protein particle complex subunit 10
MEHTLRSGTSGVTGAPSSVLTLHSADSLVVEYTDPSGIFADIEPLLKDRLPLRNLHWKSPSRPLRSIDSLHVSLVQGKEKRPTSDPAGAATTQRRHQIPGLRQTPYLKIYFLRCDDNETYKTTSRKLIREWLKENTPSSQSSSSVNNQEHHDAFEWLIIQVVYPDTPAANLSRSSSTASAAKASNEKLGSTKWPGRGSSTVFEKIKADFNGSSKSSPDRVAQISLPRPSSQPQSRPAGVELREHDEPWGDLTDKLKSLILTSFDLRVSQYEEDIREKDSQRNLPGWNFCTFFILKEGLARGFENVGLFEDALIGYDELAIGLDVIVRDQGDGSENATGGTFLSYSESLRKDLLDKLNNETSSVESGSSKQPITLKMMQDEYPLNVDQKPYRELILASNISIFDVRVYIFARQLTLLLKAANATSLLTSLDDPTTNSPSAGLGKEFDAEDLLTLAEACRRATDFISIGARNLRNDLESGFYEFHSPSDTGPRFLQTVTQTIDHMVKSWTFGVALQVLEQTATKGLSIPASALLNGNGPNGSNTAKTGQSTSDISNHHLSMPTRKSSLPSNASQIPRRSSSEMFSPDLETAPSTLHDIGNPSGGQQPTPHTINRTGTEDLASWRAEVFLLARSVLQGLAKKRDWLIDCTGLETLHSVDELKEVSLDGQSPSESESEHELPSNSLISSGGLTLDLLRRTASTLDNLKKVYEQLTDLALRHFLAANRTRSAERLFADMAVLKFRSDDFASAASYFHRVAPFYGATHWTVLEGTMLELYARCLKKLDRKEDYVHVLLRLLPKYVTSREIPGVPVHSGDAVGDVDSHGSDAPDLVSGYVDDLFIFSKELGKGISVPLEDLFGGLEIEPRIWHCEEKDGFQVRFKMHSLLGNEIPLQNVRVKLLESADVLPREIWLENGQDVVVKAEQSTIVVETNVGNMKLF